MFEPPLLVFSRGYGVIDMALLSVIRRWHFREHLSIREISRRTGLSRNTIRKYLRSDDVEPRFKVLDRPSKLDPFADRLSAWLKTEANKPRKQKRTIKQLHTDLMSLGYDAPMVVSRHSPGVGKPIGRGNCRRRVVGHSFRWPSNLAKRSSSTGPRTGRSSAMSAPSCRWPTRS